jgi:hypothetical protein
MAMAVCKEFVTSATIVRHLSQSRQPTLKVTAMSIASCCEDRIVKEWFQKMQSD